MKTKIITVQPLMFIMTQAKLYGMWTWKCIFTMALHILTQCNVYIQNNQLLSRLIFLRINPPPDF